MRISASGLPVKFWWCVVGAFFLAFVGISFPGNAMGETATYDLFLFRSNGKPAAGASLRIMSVTGELPSRTSDDEGRVRIEGLQADEPAFLLATTKDGRERVFVPILVVPEGWHMMTLRLYPPGYASGELLDEQGQPARGVDVSLSGWEWLNIAELGGCETTDQWGRFEIPGLIAGAYYRVVATEGPKDSPARTWQSYRFEVLGWDGRHDVGFLLPEGSDPSAERPDGDLIGVVSSGLEDEWFDHKNRVWKPAVETHDPNMGWCPPPEGATWIWRAGRPDAMAEKYGAKVEFRRLFSAPPAEKKFVGYLTIAADDYAAVQLNGHWIGQTNEYMRTVSMVVPPDFFRAEKNELRATVRNKSGTTRDFYNPTGIAYRLELIEIGE